MVASLRLLSLFSIVIGLAVPCYPALADANSKADEDAGAILFRDKGCTFCHGPNSSGSKKGPLLDHIRTDKAWPPARITKQILDGGQKMPPFRESLDDTEIAQLVAYLRAKGKPIPPHTAPAPSR